MGKFVGFWFWESRIVRAALRSASDTGDLSVSLSEVARLVSRRSWKERSLIKLAGKMEALRIGHVAEAGGGDGPHPVIFALRPDWRSEVPPAFFKTSRPDPL